MGVTPLRMFSMEVLREVCCIFTEFMKPFSLTGTNLSDEHLLSLFKISQDDANESEILTSLQKLLAQLETIQNNVIQKQDKELNCESMDQNTDVDVCRMEVDAATIHLPSTDIRPVMTSNSEDHLQNRSLTMDSENQSQNTSLTLNSEGHSQNKSLTMDSENRSLTLKSGKQSHERTTSDDYDVNPNIVQIKASKDEIDRRISAFIEKKQREVNVLNNREFCSVITPESEPEASCARTDAVFIPRAGCRSHIKISRVVNPSGPQTQFNPEVTRVDTRGGESSEFSGIEERMKNIESHLQLQLGGFSKSDVYGRLRALENRILFLEGLSPEYFCSMPQVKRPKVTNDLQTVHNTDEELSLQELDNRILSLQTSLQRKGQFHNQ